MIHTEERSKDGLLSKSIYGANNMGKLYNEVILRLL